MPRDFRIDRERVIQDLENVKTYVEEIQNANRLHGIGSETNKYAKDKVRLHAELAMERIKSLLMHVGRDDGAS